MFHYDETTASDVVLPPEVVVVTRVLTGIFTIILIQCLNYIALSVHQPLPNE
jgi:hypothetical protein